MGSLALFKCLLGQLILRDEFEMTKEPIVVAGFVLITQVTNSDFQLSCEAIQSKYT